MPYAKLDQGAISVYPFSLGQLKLDNPNTSFPRDPANIPLADYGVVEVVDVALPAYDSAIEKIVEGTPVDNAGTWERTWAVVALTQQEIDDRLDSADNNEVVNNLKKIAILQYALIDALLANATIAAVDFDVKSRAVYQDLKPVIDRLRAKL